MAIAQDTFFIPDDIATGLATGLYRRIGSVARRAVGPNKGQIVKHLQPCCRFDYWQQVVKYNCYTEDKNDAGEFKVT